MKLSYNWLKELVPDLKQSPEEVADVLTRHSFETTVSQAIEIDANIRIVRIEKVESHPNADRLRLATVTDGKEEITVVCGAPNIEAGQVVPYSPPGATVLDGDGNPFTVRLAKIRGVESPGMLNSLRELGLHEKEHGGIWILPSDLPLGDSLANHIESDVVLEADITPNRAHDCLSHLGVARELAALLRLSVKEPKLSDLPNETSDWTVSVEDPHDSPRYMGIELRDARIGPSPLWLQMRLLAAGGKPKNNLIDITNYVSFEVGNPTHLFDVDQLSDKKISVRTAQDKETFTALDEAEYVLSPEDLVIENGDDPVAIAGVMGGLTSGIQANSSSLLLEIANFRSYRIQETSRRLSLRSESSTRFSKGIHPALVEVAARRSLALLQDIANCSVVGMVDHYPAPKPKQTISLRPSEAGHVAGVAIEKDEVIDALTRLRFKVQESGDTWAVDVPYDRLDIDGEHDLIEEVIRVIGLDAIVADTKFAGSPAALPGSVVYRERLRDNLVALGFTETYNYSFEPAVYAAVAGIETEPHLALKNPLAPEMSQLRISLLPGLLGNLATNQSYFQRNSSKKEQALFEVGNVYAPGDSLRVPGVREGLRVAGAVVAKGVSEQKLIAAIADAFQVDQEIVKAAGVFRVLDSATQKKLKYRIPVAVFEYDVSEIMVHTESNKVDASEYAADLSESAVQFIPYSKYPSAMRDISLLVDPSVSVEAAQEVMERTGGVFVVDVDLFDEVQWKDAGKKGLAFHVEYQADDHTMTEAEISSLHQSISDALVSELGATIR